MQITNIYQSLQNKTVVITGGGSGIGAVMVQYFALQGAKVYFCDIDVQSSESLVTTHDNIYFTLVDVTDIGALHRFIDTVAQNTRQDTGQDTGQIDVLINNASSDNRHDLSDITPEYWDKCLNINLRPYVFAIQHVQKYMSKQGGSIINMGSVSWMRRRPNMVGYTTAKGAIHALTRTTAQELGGANIRVNSIVPGAVLTERQQKMWLTPELEQSFYADQALQFRVLPEDITAMALFLASDDSRACTGQNFVVDAGIV